VPQVEGHPGCLLPLRVEAEQLARELAHRLPDSVLEVVPGLAAELGQCRGGTVDADVTGDLPQLLVRNVEAVVAAEAEEEVVARDSLPTPWSSWTT
jgi:hypothetical protein